MQPWESVTANRRAARGGGREWAGPGRKGKACAGQCGTGSADDWLGAGDAPPLARKLAPICLARAAVPTSLSRKSDARMRHLAHRRRATLSGSSGSRRKFHRIYRTPCRASPRGSLSRPRSDGAIFAPRRRRVPAATPTAQVRRGPNFGARPLSRSAASAATDSCRRRRHPTRLRPQRPPA
jgi:hypothetical protein